MKKGIKDIRDNKVRDLAQTLKASGMAASETEAIRMARDMTDTASKVTENIEDKERGDEVGVTYKQEKSAEEVMPEKNKANTETQSQRSETPSQQKQTLEEDQEDKVQVDDGSKTVDQGLEQKGERPESEEVDFSEVSVEEAAGLEPEDEEQSEPEEQKEEPQSDPTPRGKPREEPDAQVEENTTSAQSKEAEEETQPTEQETQEKETKKSPEDYAESDVDLSETFKFS